MSGRAARERRRTSTCDTSWRRYGARCLRANTVDPFISPSGLRQWRPPLTNVAVLSEISASVGRFFDPDGAALVSSLIVGNGDGTGDYQLAPAGNGEKMQCMRECWSNETQQHGTTMGELRAMEHATTGVREPWDASEPVARTSGGQDDNGHGAFRH